MTVSMLAVSLVYGKAVAKVCKSVAKRVDWLDDCQDDLMATMTAVLSVAWKAALRAE